MVTPIICNSATLIILFNYIIFSSFFNDNFTLIKLNKIWEYTHNQSIPWTTSHLPNFNTFKSAWNSWPCMNQVSFGQWELHLITFLFAIVTVNTVVLSTITLISSTTKTSIKLWVLQLSIRTIKFFHWQKTFTLMVLWV